MDYQHYVSIDTETALIDRGPDLAPPLACMTGCSSENMEPWITKERHVLHNLHVIAQSGATITGANFAYDAHVLLRAFPEFTEDMLSLYDQGRIHDVQLNERLIDISRGTLDQKYVPSIDKHVPKYYSLAALYDEYGFGTLDKSADTWRLRYGSLIPVPLSQWPADAKQYAMDDALATLRVQQAQQQYGNYWQDDAGAQARGAFALQKVAIRGLITDGQMVEQYIRKLKGSIDDARGKLDRAGFVRSDGSRDTKLVREHMRVICLAMGVEPKLTEKGQVSLDTEACLAVPSDELLSAYSLYSTADKVLTRAEELLEGSKGLPLQTQFVSLLANGRTSSRNPKPPLIGCQTQNLPREGDLRKCFIPRPGYLYLSIDYNADEIVSFAQAELYLTGSSKLFEALRDGFDVHCMLAADLLGCSYAEAFSNRKFGKYKSARQLAKIGNFGLLGGMGAKTLMINANKKARTPADRITLQQAYKLRETWYRRWQTKPYFDAVNSALGHDPYSNVCTIRQFGSHRIRGGMSFPEACNTLFSGLAGDANKDVLYQCVRAAILAKPSEPLYDTHVVNFLHDELFFEVPANRATTCAKELCNLMLQVKRKWVPMVPTSAEPALMRRWYKDAEPVWSPEGELLPWEPVSLAA